MMKENFYKLKAKALKVSVFDLEKREKEDDYLDEYGMVSRGEEITENNNEES